jgi:hypothetical protein
MTSSELRATSSRSQVLMRAASAAARLTWDRVFVSVHRRPLLSVAIVTHLATRSLASRAVLPAGRATRVWSYGR